MVISGYQLLMYFSNASKWIKCISWWGKLRKHFDRISYFLWAIWDYYIPLIKLCHAAFKENGLNISFFLSEFRPVLKTETVWWTNLPFLWQCQMIWTSSFQNIACFLVCLFVFLNEVWSVFEFRPIQYPQRRRPPF